MVIISKIKEHSTLDHNDHCSARTAMLRKPKSPLKVARTALQALKEGSTMSLVAWRWDGNIENSSALNRECCKCPIFLTKDGGALCPNLCGTKDMRGRQSGEKLELTPATIEPRHSGALGVSQLLIYIYHQHNNESIKHWAHDRRHSRFEYQ